LWSREELEGGGLGDPVTGVEPEVLTLDTVSVTLDAAIYQMFITGPPGFGVVFVSSLNLKDDDAFITITFDVDSDGDGLSDAEEIDTGSDGFITDQDNPDTDGDGLIDGLDGFVACDNPPPAPCNGVDRNVDGFIDGERDLGIDTDPTKRDSDGDDAWDSLEVTAGTDPLDDTSYPMNPDGDISGDGNVNAADLLLANRILTNLITPTPYQFVHGNVAPLVAGVPSPDSQITAGDLLVIQRKVQGIINF
jgi:hypothetical protein